VIRQELVDWNTCAPFNSGEGVEANGSRCGAERMSISDDTLLQETHL
jgi:hypothetical protein